MLSYLIAVEIYRIIESEIDFRRVNFDLDLLLEDMQGNNEEKVLEQIEDKRKSNEKYKYCVKIEGNKIKFASYCKS